MLFCFIIISVEVLLYVLGYTFCVEHHVLVHFSKMLLPLKVSKILCTKATLLCTENVDEIDPLMPDKLS